MTIANLSERALISRLRARVPASGPSVLLGIGDDAAVVAQPRGTVSVVTTDVLVEDVHFRRSWTSPADIGAKAVAVNLSDLAAMGAAPQALLLSLVLPSTCAIDDFDALVDSVVHEARSAGAALIGGNIARSPGPWMIDITAMGTVRPRRVLRRAGARPGDAMFVTGRLGAAAVGLALLESGSLATDDEALACVTAQRRPSARLRTGYIVANNRAASACMDLSDGLSDAAQQICDASQCGADIDMSQVPRHPLASPAQALSGGEDYELLFTVPRRRRRLFLAAIRQANEVGVTEIGVCTKGTAVRIVDGPSTEAAPAGFGHF